MSEEYIKNNKFSGFIISQNRDNCSLSSGTSFSNYHKSEINPLHYNYSIYIVLLSNHYKTRPVFGVQGFVGLQIDLLGGLQCLPVIFARKQLFIKSHHQFAGVGVVYLPQRKHNIARPGIQKTTRQREYPFAFGKFAHPRFATAEHQQVGIECHIVYLAGKQTTRGSGIKIYPACRQLWFFWGQNRPWQGWHF